MTFIAVWEAEQAAAALLTDALAGMDVIAADMTETSEGRWTVTAYFEFEPDESDLLRIARSALDEDGAAPTVSFLPDEDWVAKSLGILAPVRAGGFVVHGSHDRHVLQPNDIGLEIEAARAFGTGHHGTTAGCLEVLFDLHKAYRFGNALDLGTGTGVLAIGIARLWHIPVLASDIDPVAVEIANENAALNQVSRLVHAVEAAGFRQRELRAGTFDLIVANILAGPLAALAPEVARHLSRNGIVVLSGLLPTQRRRILAAYGGQGLRHRRSIIRNGWLTLVLGGGAR